MRNSCDREYGKPVYWYSEIQAWATDRTLATRYRTELIALKVIEMLQLSRPKNQALAVRA